MAGDHAEVDNNARLGPAQAGAQKRRVLNRIAAPIKSYECFLDLLLRPLVQRTPVIP
jgi:hypothetical protein